MEVTEYKAGDRVRVIRVPSPGYLSPRGDGDLRVGEELEVVAPVYYDLTAGGQNLRFRVNLSIAGFGHIPFDCVELISGARDTISECKCDVWISGCTCGVFKREQELKKSSCGESRS